MRSVTDMGVVVHQMASAVMAHRAALSQVTTQQAALQKAAEDAANVSWRWGSEPQMAFTWS